MFSMQDELEINYLEKSYPFIIVRKLGMKSITVRLKKNGVLEAHAGFLVPRSQIISFAKECLPKLVRRKQRQQQKKPAYEDGLVYILGEKVEVGILDKKELTAFLMEKAKPVFTERLRYYEQIMGVPISYKLRIKNMSSRYGSNSPHTHSISLSLELIHYSLPIIDSVVIHELAHHFVLAHDKYFYSIVLQYCPDYRERKKKLRNHVYS